MNRRTAMLEVKDLVEQLTTETLMPLKVIPWAAPVISFGSMTDSLVATIGLNPSNKEFIGDAGEQLAGLDRRFHTLNSLGLASWCEATSVHHGLILDSCEHYFERNPYDTWFKRLDGILAGLGVSYYDRFSSACHLDLVPYATALKWTELSPSQRDSLLQLSINTLVRLIQLSNIRILVLNGRSVVRQFEMIADGPLEACSMPSWALRRGDGVIQGFSYRGYIAMLGGVPLGRRILVLGFNHNIQSSFGVTNAVVTSIRAWIGKSSLEALV